MLGWSGLLFLVWFCRGRHPYLHIILQTVGLLLLFPCKGVCLPRAALRVASHIYMSYDFVVLLRQLSAQVNLKNPAPYLSLTIFPRMSSRALPCSTIDSIPIRKLRHISSHVTCLQSKLTFLSPTNFSSIWEQAGWDHTFSITCIGFFGIGIEQTEDDQDGSEPLPLANFWWVGRARRCCMRSLLLIHFTRFLILRCHSLTSSLITPCCWCGSTVPQRIHICWVFELEKIWQLVGKRAHDIVAISSLLRFEARIRNLCTTAGFCYRRLQRRQEQEDTRKILRYFIEEPSVSWYGVLTFSSIRGQSAWISEYVMALARWITKYLPNLESSCSGACLSGYGSGILVVAEMEVEVVVLKWCRESNFCHIICKNLR